MPLRAKSLTTQSMACWLRQGGTVVEDNEWRSRRTVELESYGLP
jgi:hypothetical protein